MHSPQTIYDESKDRHETMILRHGNLECICSKLEIEHIRSKFFWFKNEVRYGIPA